MIGESGLYLIDVQRKTRRLVVPAFEPDNPYDFDLLIRGISQDGNTLAFDAYTNKSRPKVASPLVVFERDEVSSVAGSLLFGRAGGTATAGRQGPMWLTTASSSRSPVKDKRGGARWSSPRWTS